MNSVTPPLVFNIPARPLPPLLQEDEYLMRLSLVVVNVALAAQVQQIQFYVSVTLVDLHLKQNKAFFLKMDFLADRCFCTLI